MADLANPFNIGIVPKKLTDAELARAVRMDVAAEIEAINLYEAHIAATDNEHAKRIIGHILHEEREHLAEFLELVKELDPLQVEAEAEARAQFPKIEAGLPTDSSSESKSPGFTVGSLIEEQQAS